MHSNRRLPRGTGRRKRDVKTAIPSGTETREFLKAAIGGFRRLAGSSESILQDYGRQH